MMSSTVAPVRNWTQAMVRVADGGFVRGADVMSLVGMLSAEQPYYRRAVYEARRLRELIFSAMALARQIDEGDGWLQLMLDFRGELDRATAERRPIASNWRTFAWHLGMTADFAVGLVRARLLA